MGSVRRDLSEDDVRRLLAVARFVDKNGKPLLVSGGQVRSLIDSLGRIPTVLSNLEKRIRSKSREAFENRIFRTLKECKWLENQPLYLPALEHLDFLYSLERGEPSISKPSDALQRWIGEAKDLDRALEILVRRRNRFDLMMTNFHGGPHAFIISQVLPRIIQVHLGVGIAKGSTASSSRFVGQVLEKLDVRSPQSRNYYTNDMILDVWKRYPPYNSRRKSSFI